MVVSVRQYVRLQSFCQIFEEYTSGMFLPSHPPEKRYKAQSVLLVFLMTASIIVHRIHIQSWFIPNVHPNVIAGWILLKDPFRGLFVKSILEPGSKSVTPTVKSALRSESTPNVSIQPAGLFLNRSPRSTSRPFIIWDVYHFPSLIYHFIKFQRQFAKYQDRNKQHNMLSFCQHFTTVVGAIVFQIDVEISINSRAIFEIC